MHIFYRHGIDSRNKWLSYKLISKIWFDYDFTINLKKGNVDNKYQAISNVMITSYTWHELVEKEKFCSFKQILKN